MPPNNPFDLQVNRATNGRYVSRSESDDSFHQKTRLREEENMKNRELDRKSQEVLDELHERRWALMYLQHLANRVIEKDKVEIEFSDVPVQSMASLSMDDDADSSVPQALYKQSTERHLEVLEQRRRDARIGQEASWLALNTLAAGLTADIQSPVEDADIAFRLFHDKSQAALFESRRDIRCGNWQQFDLTKPLKREEAKEHIENKAKKTPYISISTSPLRIWNLVPRAQKIAAEKKIPDPKIAVVDLQTLRRLGIAYGSSIEDLGFQPLNKSNGTGTLFATKHHVLVLGWLPPQSILGFLSIREFEALLKESRIEKASSGDTSLSEYEKKISFSAIMQFLGGKGDSSHALRSGLELLQKT